MFVVVDSGVGVVVVYAAVVVLYMVVSYLL